MGWDFAYNVRGGGGEVGQVCNLVGDFESF